MALGSSFFFVTARNFLVERLGDRFDTKIEQLHIYVQWNIANTIIYLLCMLYMLFLRHSFGFAFCGRCGRVVCGPIGKVGRGFLEIVEPAWQAGRGVC